MTRETGENMSTTEHKAPSASTDELAAAVRQAVAEGIKAAVRDPDTVAEFWGSGLKQLQAGAARQTGAFVLGGLRGVGLRLFQFLILGSIVYSLGGWAAVAKLWNGIWVGGS